MARRRRTRRNPALSTVLAGVAGFAAVPLAAGAVNTIAHARNPEEPPSELVGRGMVANAIAGIAALAGGASSSSPAARAALFAGAAGAAIGVYGWFAAGGAAGALPTPGPAPSNVPDGVDPSLRSNPWRELSGDPIVHQAGARYRVLVDLPFYAEPLASDDAIRKYAADRGFNVTTISRVRPDPSWPADDDADLYVEAIATRSGSLERPGAILWAGGIV